MVQYTQKTNIMLMGQEGMITTAKVMQWRETKLLAEQVMRGGENVLELLTAKNEKK